MFSPTLLFRGNHILPIHSCLSSCLHIFYLKSRDTVVGGGNGCGLFLLASMYACKYCCFRCTQWLFFLRHSFQAHSSVPNFSFSCDVEGCHQTFKKYSSIQSHLNRKHRNCDLENIRNDLEHGSSVGNDFDQNSVNKDHDSDNTDGFDDEGSDDVGDHDEESEAVCSSQPKVTLEKSAALFLMTLKEKYKLTQTAVGFSIDQIITIIDISLQQAKDQVESIVNGVGTDIPDLSECFNIDDPFAALNSEYLQTKFYREHFGLIVSYSHFVFFSVTKISVNTHTHYNPLHTCCGHFKLVDFLSQVHDS